MKEILVTDSLFIHDEHVKDLETAGFKVTRLDKPAASEEEIISAIKDKSGYILGGTEQVTEKVLDAANKLEVISFSGVGYKHFIPAWEYATKKGIAITNAPDGPTHAVTEWALSVALAMTRGLFELGRVVGSKDFMTTKGLENQEIGIIGLGRIGSEIAQSIKSFRPKAVSYYSRIRHEDKEQALGVSYKDLSILLQESDVVFLCVSADAGEKFFNAEKLSQMKRGSLLVSFMPTGIVDGNDLFAELSSGRIRAASDYPMGDKFKGLPISVWYSFNGSNAFNTVPELKLTSDMVTKSIINVLNTGDDKYVVNPEFKSFKV